MVTEVLSWRTGQGASTPSFHSLFAVFSSLPQPSSSPPLFLRCYLSRVSDSGSHFTDGYGGAQEGPTSHLEVYLGHRVQTSLVTQCLVKIKLSQLHVGCFPDVFLPRTSPWKRAFLGTLVGLLLLLALLLKLVLYIFQKQRRSQGTKQSWSCSPGASFAQEESGAGGCRRAAWSGHPAQWQRAHSCPLPFFLPFQKN